MEHLVLIGLELSNNKVCNTLGLQRIKTPIEPNNKNEISF